MPRAQAWEPSPPPPRMHLPRLLMLGKAWHAKDKIGVINLEQRQSALALPQHLGDYRRTGLALLAAQMAGHLDGVAPEDAAARLLEPAVRDQIEARFPPERDMSSSCSTRTATASPSRSGVTANGPVSTSWHPSPKCNPTSFRATLPTSGPASRGRLGADQRRLRAFCGARQPTAAPVARCAHDRYYGPKASPCHSTSA